MKEGNNRTGFVLAALFLETSGLRFTAPEEQAVLLTVGLADKSVAPEQYAQWLKDNSVSRT